LGIAHYHASDYRQAVVELMKGNPPNLARRHLAAAYVRLDQLDDAKRVAAEFLAMDPTYTLSREGGWPYKDSESLEALLIDLRMAGFPDCTNSMQSEKLT
jgi:hypothetical protein